jgi:hypothetical protein
VKVEALLWWDDLEEAARLDNLKARVARPTRKLIYGSLGRTEPLDEVLQKLPVGTLDKPNQGRHSDAHVVHVEPAPSVVSGNTGTVGNPRCRRPWTPHNSCIRR